VYIPESNSDYYQHRDDANGPEKSCALSFTQPTPQFKFGTVAWGHTLNTSSGASSRTKSATLTLVDPFELVRDDITSLSDNIKNLIGSHHPVLAAAAEHFFGVHQGRKIRPTIVLLIAHAVAQAARSEQVEQSKEQEAQVLDLQRRLAEITDMYHTAIMFHDGCICVCVYCTCTWHIAQGGMQNKMYKKRKRGEGGRPK
jgi:hypothetical protein